jgi:hypothetical protein
VDGTRIDDLEEKQDADFQSVTLTHLI